MLYTASSTTSYLLLCINIFHNKSRKCCLFFALHVCELWSKTLKELCKANKIYEFKSLWLVWSNKMKLGHQQPGFTKNPNHCWELDKDKSKNLKAGMPAPAKLNFNLKQNVESLLVRQCGQNGISRVLDALSSICTGYPVVNWPHWLIKQSTVLNGDASPARWFF